jgi:hypothetical protein
MYIAKSKIPVDRGRVILEMFWMLLLIMIIILIMKFKDYWSVIWCHDHNMWLTCDPAGEMRNLSDFYPLLTLSCIPFTWQHCTTREGASKFSSFSRKLIKCTIMSWIYYSLQDIGEWEMKDKAVADLSGWGQCQVICHDLRTGERWNS